MYIGEFCKLTGTSTKTIRFYEQIGLLPKAQRKGRYRVYDSRFVETVRQIRIAQQLGMSLKQICQLCDGANMDFGLPRHVIDNALNNQKEKLKQEQMRIQQQLDEIKQIESQLNCSQCIDFTL